MAQSIITFSGDNTKLFTRVLADNIMQTLIVPETHNAILIKDGQMLQTLSSGKYVLSDFFDGKTESDCAIEVLFMSKTAKLKLLWGTPQKLLMFDENSGENYRAGFSGDFEVQIGEPRKCYLYLVGASQDLTVDGLQDRLQSNVVSVMETVVVDYVREKKIPYTQIAVNKQEMSQKILNALNHKLMSEYGIAVFSFNIANIIIDEEDMKRLRAQKLVCSNCGAQLSPSSKFCSKCGKQVGGGVKICPVCSTKNDENAKFCASCGNKLEEE